MRPELSPARNPGLRVAYVTMLFPARSETFVSLDVRELGRKGLAVEVHSLRPRSGDVDRLATDRGLLGVERTYNGWGATARGLGLMLAAPRRSFAYVWRLARLTTHRPLELLKSFVLLPRAFDILEELCRSQPDVVHANWGHYPALVLALVQERLPGTVVSMSLGAYDLQREYPLTASAAHAVSFVRTHCQENVRTLVDQLGLSEERIEVVYSGIDVDAVPKAVGSGGRIRGRVVTAGRLIAAKGIDDVIRAFGKIRTEQPEATLEVFGDGPERGRLEDLATSLGLRDAVTFRGHQGQRQLFDSLERAEIFLFMSKSPGERLPNVVKESMACGAVCVSTDSVGLDELIPSPDHGLIVPQGDVAGAAAAVIGLLERPERLAAMRVAARQYVIQTFDVRRTTDAYVRRWQAAIEHDVDPHGTVVAAGDPALQ